MRIAAAALVLVLAACNPASEPPAAPEAPAAQSDAPFLSAAGYGPVRIGMTIEEASTALGAQLVPDGNFDEPDACQTLHIDGVTDEDPLRFMAQGGRITRISDYGGRDATTPEGVGVASTDSEIRAAYPNAIEQPAKYNAAPAHDLIIWTTPNESGVRFEINEQGVATIVHAGDESIQLVEGCA
ncbi:hypothetical protein U91I_03015 [alpha proteobacterium U9-1i]|nr:hypothetical protein U91I_03015 [alpha proteobacterium U9-1i]